MFSERLKNRRKEKGLTQVELSKRVNITRDLYNKYERTGTRPSHETLVALAEVLETTTDYLLGRVDNPAPPAKNQDDLNHTLTEKDLREVHREAEKIKDLLLTGTSLAFDGQIQDEETLQKVMAALESGFALAKQEAKEKYTPKKYRHKKQDVNGEVEH